MAIIHEALDVLGLPPMVSWHEINERYRTLAKKHHPDSGGDTQEMAKINWAYNILKEYVQNYRFSFSEEEILRQFPHAEYLKKFRF
ncbi:J domain-containing protein [Nitratiruptor sp. YY09-18]|uniref:J domain-containing protein n=1 Tax=Nitratiruptor sp. YY09-18 TaxID=2724901 RepID=UPI001F3E0DB5|nr:J domain-containing protein [Nitratiruptor sp. YY09-18]